MTERMIDLTPEALAADAVEQGFAADYQEERIAYYHRFIRGKNAEIARLSRIIEQLTTDRRAVPGARPATGAL